MESKPTIWIISERRNRGFIKRDVRKLHNILYKEQKGYKNNGDNDRKGRDPWA